MTTAVVDDLVADAATALGIRGSPGLESFSFCPVVPHLVQLGEQLRERGVQLRGHRARHRHQQTRRARNVRHALGARRAPARAHRRQHPVTAWPLPVRAGRPGGRKPRLNAEQIAMARKLYDVGAHTVARTGPDYRCAKVDGLPGHDRHTAGVDSVMENRHMVTLRSAAPPDAGDVARVHVRSWQAAYRGLLPADFLAGLQPTDWAAGYTFDAQDPVTTVAVDSRSGIVGSPRCRSHLRSVG